MFTDDDGGVAQVGVVGAATPAFLLLTALAHHRQGLSELRKFTEISNIQHNNDRTQTTERQSADMQNTNGVNQLES